MNQSTCSVYNFVLIVFLQYQPGQTWKTWSTGYSIRDIVENEHDLSVISKATQAYIKVVNELLYELENDLYAAKTQVLNSMASASDLLGRFKAKAQISTEFVL